VSLDGVPAIAILAAAGVYVRGWIRLSQRMPGGHPAARLAAFLAGLAIALLAVSSPLHSLAGRLLQAHMVQHMLLIMVAPSLLWLGAPWAPMLLGLPRPFRLAAAAILGAAPLRRLGRALASPGLAWVSFSAVLWAWHTPMLYDLALRSDLWHHIEHACFGAAGLLFWRPVIVPWPARPIWSRWAMVAYLLLADAQNTALAAVLTFSDRVIYSAYESAPRVWAISALEDQSVAGVIMWVPGSAMFLVAVAWVLVGAWPRRALQ